MSKSPYVRFNAWPGGFNLRIGKRFLSLRTPLDRPLFGERYGYRKPFFAAFGWRWFWEPLRAYPCHTDPASVDRDGDTSQ